MVDYNLALFDISRVMFQMGIRQMDIKLTGLDTEKSYRKLAGTYHELGGDTYEFTCKYDPKTRTVNSFNRGRRVKRD